MPEKEIGHLIKMEVSITYVFFNHRRNVDETGGGGWLVSLGGIYDLEASLYFTTIRIVIGYAVI